MTSSRGHDGRPLLHAAGRWLRALGALMLIASLLAGLPAILATAAGWPLPHSVPSITEVQAVLTTEGIPDQVLIDTLACLGWVLWASLTLSFGVEILAVVSRVPVPRLPGLSPMQAITAVLFGAITVGVLAGRPVPAQAMASQPHAVADASSRADGGHPAAKPQADGVSTRTYTVRAPHDGVHDSLWRIADRELGDGHRWLAIYRLNRGRPQLDGRALLDPDLIYPGWRLRLPGQTSPAQPQHQTPRTAPVEPTTQSRPTTPTIMTSAPSVAPTQAPTRDPGTTAPASAAPNAVGHHGGHGGVRLPDGGYVGLGLAAAVGGALVVWRHRRRRGSLSRWPIDVDTERPSEPPLPLTVRVLRRADLHAGHADDDLDDADGIEDVGDEPADVPPPVAGVAVEDPAVRDENGTLVIGLVDGRQVPLRAIRDGLTLTGPGAVPVARALVAHVVTDATSRRPEDRPTVVMPDLDVARVLGADHPEALGLTQVASLATALEHIEGEAVHRLRMLSDHDAADATELAATQPDEEPMPAVVLLATARPGYSERLAALRPAVTAEVHLVLLGEADEGTICDVAADGTVTHVGGAGATALAGARLFTLTAAEAAELLQLTQTDGSERMDMPPQGTAQGLVDTERVRTVSPHRKDADHAQSVSQGVPRRCDRGGT